MRHREHNYGGASIVFTTSIPIHFPGQLLFQHDLWPRGYDLSCFPLTDGCPEGGHTLVMGVKRLQI